MRNGTITAMNLPTESNPLLEFSGPVRFDSMRVEHVAPAIDRLLAVARAAVASVAADDGPATWESVAEPITDALDRLDRAWSVVRHLNAVMSTPALRDAYHACLPKVAAFFADLAQHPGLYARYKALAAAPSFATLEAAKRRAVDNELRDFRLGGAELEPAGKARLKAIQEELSDLSARFDDNLLDATNDWCLYVENEAELAGVPHETVAEARAEAKAEGREGFKLTLRMPCYLPVLTYADNRELRARMHRAYATRASDLGDTPARDNGPIVDRVLALRREAAQLLGYANHAEVSLVPRMARSVDEVVAFLRDLARRARPHAERDYAELVTFARGELGLAEIAPWDLAFASEKLKARRFAFTEQEIRRYFPEERVLAGLFGVARSLFGVDVRASKAPTWHPTVRFYDLCDRSGALIGQFYVDNYARPGKQGGAWMDDAVNRRLAAGTLQRPVAYLTCNLTPPLGDEPATFTHREVTTLFHEFGHGLHQLLTQVDVAGVSGIQGVEWDAVELPSQFMENYCWEWDVLREMTAYVGAGESHGAPLPREIFERMRSARNFQSALTMLRHLEYALFDILVHSAFDSNGGVSPQSVLDTVRQEIAVVPIAPYDRFLQSFAHVFAGGYSAGYYSYKWAEVLAADAFARFEEEGVLCSATGARFRDEVLARGGSRPAMESFVAFRGREPQLDALLRHNGLAGPVQEGEP
jgi:oligopeptidase A